MILQRVREGGLYGLSFLLTAVVIGNAFHQKKQFYPAVVYLTKSNPSLAVLAAQSLVFVVLLGKLTRKIFFGSLRAAEIEHLIERSWYAVTETCLAFTVFREDFNVTFVAMFTMLLFFKCFHWLAEDRVDYMERSPMLGWIFHSRILGLLAMLGIVDYYFMKNAYYTTMMKGASAQLVFGFEYAILVTIILTILVKYTLHCIDLYDENPWENKAVYLLYLELATNGWKFLLYVMFVAIMSKVHTFPLFAIRPLYLTMRSFKKALSDVILSRRAIRNMNQLYPDATEEDLQGMDVCIICREQMSVEGGCKKLPCTHIFHASCLRSWFQRQQTCPTCRMEVLNIPTQGAGAARQAPANQVPAAQAAPPAAGQAAAAQARHLHQALFRHLRMPVPPGFPQPPVAGAQAPAPPAAGPSPQSNAATPNQSTTQPPIPPNPPVFGGFPGGFPPMPNFPNTSTPGADQNNTTPFMPPNLFPFMPTMPLSMPLADLSRHSEEELRRMESDEREALEARIQWIRDIQTLIDSAVEQMHQYTLVMSALNATRPPVRPTNNTTSASADSTKQNTANNADNNIKAPPRAPVLQSIRSEGSTLLPPSYEASGGTRPKSSSPTEVSSSTLSPTPRHNPAGSSSPGISSPGTSSPGTSSQGTTSPAMSQQGVVPSVTSASSTVGSVQGSASGSTSEQEEIRRRRLARFSQEETNSG